MEENCHVEPIQKTTTVEERLKTNIAFLTVWGMGCPNCAARVRNGLISLNGVINANVDHIAGVARVIYNPDLATVEMLTLAVASAGNDGRHEYGARLLNNEVLS